MGDQQMISTNMFRTEPHAAPLRNAVKSLRMTTRIWYDVIFPITTLMVMVGLALPIVQTLLCVAAMLSFHAGQTLFNDVADVAVDSASEEQSRQRRSLVRGEFSSRTFMIAGWVLVGLGIAAAVPLGKAALAIVALATLIALAYNFEPIHLAGVPLATQVFWPVTWLLLYGFCAAALDFRGWQNGLAYLISCMLFMGIGEGLGQDLRDADNDEAGGRNTSVVRFGVGPAAVVAWLGFAAGAVVWIDFVLSRGLGVPVAIIGGVIFAAWLVVAGLATRRLWRGFRKEDGRLIHVGSIWTYTLTNLLLIAALSTSGVFARGWP
jgi:4-hydroxybenzoate polyprenyltransferase